MIPRMLEEEGSMIARHLQDEIDIAGLALEREDLVRVPEIEDERTLADRKIGSNSLRHLKPQVLYPIQTILLVTFQRYTINTRYKWLCQFDSFMNKNRKLCPITSINFIVYFAYYFV